MRCHGNVCRPWLIISLTRLDWIHSGRNLSLPKPFFGLESALWRSPISPAISTLFAAYPQSSYIMSLFSLASFHLTSQGTVSSSKFLLLELTVQQSYQSLFQEAWQTFFFSNCNSSFLFETRHFYNKLASFTCREKEMRTWKFCDILQLPSEINDPRCICIIGSFSPHYVEAYGV